MERTSAKEDRNHQPPSSPPSDPSSLPQTLLPASILIKCVSNSTRIMGQQGLVCGLFAMILTMMTTIDTTSALYNSPTLKEFVESPSYCKSASPASTKYYAHTNSSHSNLSCSNLKDTFPTNGPSVSINASPRINLFMSSPISSSKGTNGNRVYQNFSSPPSTSHCGSPVEKRILTPPFGSPTPNYKIS